MLLFTCKKCSVEYLLLRLIVVMIIYCLILLSSSPSKEVVKGAQAKNMAVTALS